MTSIFEKRATEHLKNDEAFLAHIAPAPLDTYVRPWAEKDVLFDRLVVVSGTPGSGKTTIARLFRFQTLIKLQALAGSSKSLPELRDVMSNCGAYDAEYPAVAGCHLSMETDYRDIWECPYEESIRHRLLQMLVNARVVLGWARGFREAEIDLKNVRVIFKPDAEGALETIGGSTLAELQEHARIIESETYKIAVALIPPALEDFPQVVRNPYRPIDFISRFEVKFADATRQLVPLAILDDAHALSQAQRESVLRWLAAREVPIARWVMWRFDALRPDQVLYDRDLSLEFGATEPEPGVQVSRDITEIRLQRPKDRLKARRDFRLMARQMSQRYLEQIPLFQRRGATDMAAMLDDRVDEIAAGKLEAIHEQLETTLRNERLSKPQLAELEKQVAGQLERSEIRGVEATALHDAMLRILAQRLANRRKQGGLFAGGEDDEDTEDYGVKAKAGIEHGARIHLWHSQQIPYLFGFEKICDIANENPEQFLHFAGQLVALLETKLIRGRDPRLSAREQHQVIHEHAKRVVRAWNFPESGNLRRLAAAMARQCVEASLSPTAKLNGGANAFGIPQKEFETLAKDHEDFARILKFGVAYNVFTVLPEQRVKNKDWCLIELGGALIAANGLTLQRGGFLERTVADMLKLMQEERIA
jgi:hypothetical protein